MYLSLVCCLLLFGSPSAGQSGDDFLSKFMNTIQVGARFVSSFLQSDQSDVLASVFQRFGRVHDTDPGEFRSGPENLVPFLLRLVGLDSSRIEDYAVDGVILLAHLIGLTLTGGENPLRQQRSSSGQQEFSPFQYIVKQPQVRSLLTQMEDPNMVEFILDEGVKRLRDYPREDVECIPLLVCKLTPFVQGMQRSLRFFMGRDRDANGSCRGNSSDACDDSFDRADLDGRMFYFLPNLDDVIRYGDNCDKRFPKCVY